MSTNDDAKATYPTIAYQASLNEFARVCHNQAVEAGWWIDPKTGLIKERNVGEMLMLCVSELAGAMEGHRKGLMDDKLPHRPMFEVELADLLIRVFDIAASHAFDLHGAFLEKLHYNKHREDHKLENRMKEGGKAY